MRFRRRVAQGQSGIIPLKYQEASHNRAMPQDTTKCPMLRIGRVTVDIQALSQLKHACDPALCRAQACCCQCYEITFTRREMETAIGLMPVCAGYARHLQHAGMLENPFEPVPGGLFTVDEYEQDACAFAFRDHSGRMWCAIHAAALDLSLSPWTTKPKMCTLWPLALSEGRTPVLSVDANAYRFPCNTRRRKSLRLDAGVAACIQRVLGGRFLKRLTTALRELDMEDRNG